MIGYSFLFKKTVWWIISMVISMDYFHGTKGRFLDSSRNIGVIIFLELYMVQTQQK